MSTLSFAIPDDKAEQLTAAARERGVALEDLLRQITDDFLARKEEFKSASEYVLRKNAELYRRLAQ